MQNYRNNGMAYTNHRQTPVCVVEKTKKTICMACHWQWHMYLGKNGKIFTMQKRDFVMEQFSKN